jgi:hypothetical protein
MMLLFISSEFQPFTRPDVLSVADLHKVSAHMNLGWTKIVDFIVTAIPVIRD